MNHSLQSRREYNPSNFYSTKLQCCNKAPNGETVPFLERTIISWIRIFHTIQLVTVRKSQVRYSFVEGKSIDFGGRSNIKKKNYMAPSRKIKSKKFLFHKAAMY